jgi:hypothetical protein
MNVIGLVAGLLVGMTVVGSGSGIMMLLVGADIVHDIALIAILLVA